MISRKDRWLDFLWMFSALAVSFPVLLLICWSIVLDDWETLREEKAHGTKEW